MPNAAFNKHAPIVPALNQIDIAAPPHNYVIVLLASIFVRSQKFSQHHPFKAKAEAKKKPFTRGSKRYALLSGTVVFHLLFRGLPSNACISPLLSQVAPANPLRAFAPYMFSHIQRGSAQNLCCGLVTWLNCLSWYGKILTLLDLE